MLQCTNSSQGPTFARKATEALAGREEHVNAFLEFDAALSIDMGAEQTTSAIPIQEWKTWCLDWEKDRTTRNPFEVTKIGTSFDMIYIY